MIIRDICDKNKANKFIYYNYDGKTETIRKFNTETEMKKYFKMNNIKDSKVVLINNYRQAKKRIYVYLRIENKMIYYLDCKTCKIYKKSLEEYVNYLDDLNNDIKNNIYNLPDDIYDRIFDIAMKNAKKSIIREVVECDKHS